MERTNALVNSKDCKKSIGQGNGEHSRNNGQVVEAGGSITSSGLRDEGMVEMGYRVLVHQRQHGLSGK